VTRLAFVCAVALAACAVDNHYSVRLAARKVASAQCAKLQECTSAFALKWGEGPEAVDACTTTVENAVVAKLGKDREPDPCTSAELDTCVRDTSAMTCDELNAEKAPGSCGGC
jgi:hypothetical protein